MASRWRRRARYAPHVSKGRNGDQLFHAVEGDEHLGRFCKIPSKENGLDMEGLAVSGNRIFAGLRGPVLRGWAVVLEFELKDSGPGSVALATPLKKHFSPVGRPGRARARDPRKGLYIWPGRRWISTGRSSSTAGRRRWNKQLKLCCFGRSWRRFWLFPTGREKNAGHDHAEGIVLIERAGSPPGVMICYDSPAAGRLVENRPEQVRLDIFALA